MICPPRPLALSSARSNAPFARPAPKRSMIAAPIAAANCSTDQRGQKRCTRNSRLQRRASSRGRRAGPASALAGLARKAAVRESTPYRSFRKLPHEAELSFASKRPISHPEGFHPSIDQSFKPASDLSISRSERSLFDNQNAIALDDSILKELLATEEIGPERLGAGN